MKDLIISGGVNVYPKDIEEIVIKHPSVLEVAVIGIPHEKWGEVPVAAVILYTSSTTSETDILQWVNERVDAKFQRLHKVVVMESFPVSVAGKTLKRKIRDALV